MNGSIYLFGSLSSGFTKYPDDGTSAVLSKLYALCKAPTQVIVHRDGNLMYYCYVRKLGGRKYIGVAVLINGHYITSLSKVFATFEKAVEKLARQGLLIRLTPEGDVVPSKGKLTDKETEISNLLTWLDLQVKENWEADALPPVNYSEAKDSIKDFASTDNLQEKIRATYTYGYTIIYKEKDYDTINLKGYRAVLSGLKQKNDELKARNSELEVENARVKSEKQQDLWRTLFFVGLAVCASIVLSFRGSLSDTKSKLADANHKVEQLNTAIQGLNNDLSAKDNSIQTLESKINTLEKKVALLPPLTITKVEFCNLYKGGSIETNYGEKIYSSRSMYIGPRITYDGNRSGEITLYVKIFNPDGTLSTGTSSPSWYSYSRKISVVERTNVNQELSSWGNDTKGWWKAGTYRYEIWTDSKCIWSGTFFVY